MKGYYKAIVGNKKAEKGLAFVKKSLAEWGITSWTETVTQVQMKVQGNGGLRQSNEVEIWHEGQTKANGDKCKSVPTSLETVIVLTIEGDLVPPKPKKVKIKKSELAPTRIPPDWEWSQEDLEFLAETEKLK